MDGTGGTCTPYNPITSGGQAALDPLNRPLVQGAVYDPYSTRLVGGATVRDAFPGNRIPLSQIDPVAAAVQKLIPAANSAGIINNYFIPGFKSFTHTTNYSFKVDQNLSSTIKISGRSISIVSFGITS